MLRSVRMKCSESDILFVSVSVSVCSDEHLLTEKLQKVNVGYCMSGCRVELVGKPLKRFENALSFQSVKISHTTHQCILFNCFIEMFFAPFVSNYQPRVHMALQIKTPTGAAD